MNLATGTLTLVGLLFIILGIASKLMGMSILSPLVGSNIGYIMLGNTCLLLALVIDKFQKE